MDRCAVFVDAGYLYAEGGKLIGLGPSRRNVRLDASGANQFLVDLAVTVNLPGYCAGHTTSPWRSSSVTCPG